MEINSSFWKLCVCVCLSLVIPGQGLLTAILFNKETCFFLNEQLKDELDFYLYFLTKKVIIPVLYGHIVCLS